MSAGVLTGFPGLPRSATPEQIADFCNRLLLARLNATVTVTLNTGSVTTVSDSRLGANSYMDLMPLTASARTASLSGFYFSTQSSGSLCINHVANTATDRTFRALIIG